MPPASEAPTSSTDISLIVHRRAHVRMTQPTPHAFHPDVNTSPGEATPEQIAERRNTPEGWFPSPDPTHLPPYDPSFTYNVNYYRAFIGAFYSELGQAEESGYIVR